MRKGWYGRYLSNATALLHILLLQGANENKLTAGNTFLCYLITPDDFHAPKTCV